MFHCIGLVKPEFFLKLIFCKPQLLIRAEEIDDFIKLKIKPGIFQHVFLQFPEPFVCLLCSLDCNISPLLHLCMFLSTGMAPEVWLPPLCRPQNVSAALSSSHAVRYRCHAAPLRSQRHRDSGQQHYRVSHTPL